MDSSAEIIEENDLIYEPPHLEISFLHDDIYHHGIEKDVHLVEEVNDIEDNDNDDEQEATVLSSTGKMGNFLEGNSHKRGCQGQKITTVSDMSSSFA